VDEKVDSILAAQRGNLSGASVPKINEKLVSIIVDLSPDIMEQIKEYSVRQAKLVKQSKSLVLICLSLENKQGETVEVQVEKSKGSGKIIEFSISGIRFIDLALADGDAKNEKSAK
jgi:hypothetical protein